MTAAEVRMWALERVWGTTGNDLCVLEDSVCIAERLADWVIGARSADDAFPAEQPEPDTAPCVPGGMSGLVVTKPDPETERLALLRQGLRPGWSP